MKTAKNLKFVVENLKFAIGDLNFEIRTPKPRLCAFICGVVFLFLAACAPSPDVREDSTFSPEISLKAEPGEFEKAIFTRQEFFGVQAIVPLPTAEVRENLVRLAETDPDNPQILEKLAETCEKLERFDEAEKFFIRLSEIDAEKLETLAAFYHRRARFDREAETLRKILFSAATKKRAAIFERLIDSARIHELNEFLNDDFYAQIADENPNLYEIFEKIADKLAEEKNYAGALKFLRSAKNRFPARRDFLLQREIQILLESCQSAEAEKVYIAAFDPFWTREESQKFYDFLGERNRLRAYGAEIKARFEKNPADFDAALRLAHYRDYDFYYGNDDAAPVFARLELAKKDWTVEELLTAARFLLRKNEGDLASRFLYTLSLREDFKQKGELRAKILYQLFEIFSDAENARLTLTKGDLRFYEEAAQTDTNPGIATGILSLIFSDTKPRVRLENQEKSATKLFNRAAAYRLFEEYKKEFPDSPELAQMYLDIVRLYTAENETEIAEKILREFAERYENSKDFAAVALKLADAFKTQNQTEKEREIYRKVLDQLGKSEKPKFGGGFSSNEGIRIPTETVKPKNDYYYEPTYNFTDYTMREKGEITYEEVLYRFIASLKNEYKISEILKLFSDEIAKYPDEERLHELRIEFLENTNLFDEQFEAYRAALEKFQTNDLRDKLARFFLRRNRQAEFAEFSFDLAAKLNDAELEKYLLHTIENGISSGSLEKNLAFRLYQTARARFPHNLAFVHKLLAFYRAAERYDEWRKLAAEYFFVSKEIRRMFLDELARKSELRTLLAETSETNRAYELLRAEAFVRLSDFENAVAIFRRLNEIYPHETAFSERLINLTRSLGQKDRASLSEAAQTAKSQADFLPSSAEFRTRSGEIEAERGDYENARAEWEKLIPTARGAKEIYLDTATVYWDYFQYDDARRVIENLRQKFSDPTLYAFETGAILEAQDKRTEAVGEYVKALGADDEQKEKAKNRLAKLFFREKNEKKGNLLPLTDAAFEKEKRRRRDFSHLTLGYAEFLTKIGQLEKAETILNDAVRHSDNADFLEAALEFRRVAKNFSGERAVLRRLAETAKNPRQKIRYELKLAESYEKTAEREAAKNVLLNLVRLYPNNYGVITEAADFFGRLGYEKESLRVLENALPRSRGYYKTRLAQKLAKRLITADRLEEAELILTRLYNENKTDAGLFKELMRVCVRLNKPEKPRAILAETVTALKKSGLEPREIDWQIREMRLPLIDAFTRLRNYRAAVEQHIEIINREPDEENIENAIRYVKRYGGADVLLDYYLKLSAESFKNYRWNVVLARLYEAEGDEEKAIANYRAAIANQPEMPELYLAVAEIETRRKNFDAALKNIDEVLILTNNDEQFVRRKIEILRAAGRIAEIEAEKAKLTPETKEKIMPNDFAEARRLQATEKEKALEIFRQAFAALLENPLNGEMNSSDIVSYVQAVREEEPLDALSEKLWLLREKLIEIADEKDGINAGEARKRISILDSAMTESIGALAGDFGTDAELAALHENLKKRIEKISVSSDRYQTLSLIQDLSRRARFGDLEEIILQKKFAEAKTDRQMHLSALIDFYNERGAYRKSLETLENGETENLALTAEIARLAGEGEKELEALRRIYWKPFEKLFEAEDENITRFLEILYAEHRNELKSLTEKNSAYQLQLINFLLARGEAELAHAAIENSSFSAAWKLARNAEISLGLKELDEKSECYFCEALQLGSIGEVIEQTPDKKRFLVGDDWFRLAREYGEWLYEKNDGEIPPANFLPAMTERLPQSAEEQLKLGEFYLEKKDFARAIEHLKLAVESNANETTLAALAAAQHLDGKPETAKEIQERLLEKADAKVFETYFRIFARYGLSKPARERVAPFLVKFLTSENVDDSADFQSLIRTISASFADESEKASYFEEILKKRPTDKSLAEMLLNENLVTAENADFFFLRMLETSENLIYPDYEFQTVLSRIFDRDDAESVYEQENEYETEEPKDEFFEWRQKYIENLLARRENEKAERIIVETENALEGKCVRPVWLRLARFRTQIRKGNLNLDEMKKFIGIATSEAAAQISAPNVERFNEALKILEAENLENEKTRLSEAFFARNLAFGRFEAANFAGLARAFFRKGEGEKALRMLRLMTETSDAAKRPSALAEIASLEEIRAYEPDAAKISDETETLAFLPESLEIAAETAAEFGAFETSVEFRQKLSEIDPTNAANRLELAKLLSRNNRASEAEAILRQIIADKTVPRSIRWQAREFLQETDFPNAKFDAFAQFYAGKTASPETSVQFFIDSLVADREAPVNAREELIKRYALVGRHFAALALAENFKAEKSDDLLRILSESAEKIGDYAKAIEYEKAKTSGGDAEKTARLEKLLKGKNLRAVEWKIDTHNTRKL
jgi:hypothetical protein